MPFGHTVGGGGGGSGQGVPAATRVPSGQVCIGGGVVAQPARTTVDTMTSAIRLISFSSRSTPPANAIVAATFLQPLLRRSNEREFYVGAYAACCRWRSVTRDFMLRLSKERGLS